MHNYPDGMNTLHPTIAGRPEPVTHGLRECIEWCENAFSRCEVGTVVRCACGDYFEYTDCLGPNAPDGAEGWRHLGEYIDLEPEQVARITEG